MTVSRIRVLCVSLVVSFAVCSAQSPPDSRNEVVVESQQSLGQRTLALARRLEAGDLSCYPEYEQIFMKHVWAISKTGHSADKIPGFLVGSGSSQNTYCIDNRSIFWASFEKTIRQDPNLNISNGMYAVWCFNTHPNQKELIFDLAKVVLMQNNKIVTTKPWSDLRFCIIMDWLYSWGDESDFVKVHELLPKNAKSTFSRLHKEAKTLPGFFNAKLSLPKYVTDIQKPIPSTLADDIKSADKNENEIMTENHTPSATNDDSENADKTENKIINVSHNALKVKRQPSPPECPREARLLGLMAELTLELIIGKDGIPKGCRPKPSPWQAFFAPNSIKWAMGWQFEPSTVNGNPIESIFLLNLSFMPGRGTPHHIKRTVTLPAGRTPPRYIGF